MNEYQKQAKEFLYKTGSTLTIEFLRHGFHFENDKDTRDIYDCILTRGNREYRFEFGSSLNDSGFYYTKGVQKFDLDRDLLHKKYLRNYIKSIDRDFMATDAIHYPKSPSLYGILSCLQAYEVGTFEDFCGNFGYNTDSRTAEKIYKAVLHEYTSLCTLYSDEELELLQEIQ